MLRELHEPVYTMEVEAGRMDPVDPYLLQDIHAIRVAETLGGISPIDVVTWLPVHWVNSAEILLAARSQIAESKRKKRAK